MPGGRPTLLTQPVRQRPDGSTVTAGEQVIDQVQLGLDLQAAADSAGIDRSTLHRWNVAGARHRAQMAQGKLRKPTAGQLALVEFCNALEKAHAQAEANRLAIINRAAMGGAVVTKTTRKVQTIYAEDGTATERELERTDTTETLRPEWQAAAWWLERKRGYVRTLEVTGAGGAPLVPQAEAARDLADSLREYLQGVEDGKAEAARKPKAKPRKAKA